MHNENQDHNIDDPIIDLIPAYALGALDADEVVGVIHHLKTCLACQAELATYQTVVDAMPFAAETAEPLPALKERLMQRVQVSATPDTAVSRASSWWTPIIIRLQTFLTGPRWQPVLALVAIFLLVGAFLFWRQTSPDTLEQIELSATDIAPDAQGVIEIETNGREATLTVTGLPDLPPEQQYQLWLIEEGQRASGAIFSVNDNGWAKVPVDSERPVTEYGAFGITIEPAGGSPGPTGERVLGHNL